MTDKDKLIKLLTEFGVEFRVTNGGETVSCDHGNKKVKGTNGITTDFDFSNDGSFRHMGAYR